MKEKQNKQPKNTFKRKATIIAVSIATIIMLMAFVHAAVTFTVTNSPAHIGDVSISNIVTGGTVTKTTDYFTFTNTGDTINGNRSDAVAGNKWIRIEFSCLDPDIMPGYNEHYLYNSTTGKYCYISTIDSVEFRINGGVWHTANITSNIASSVFTAFIDDGATDYTLTTGDVVDIRFTLKIADEDAGDSDAGTYTTYTPTETTPGLTVKVQGYS